MNMAWMKWIIRYLLTIIDKFKGGPVGINTIATAVGEEAGTLEEVYEPFLIQEGFIKRTPRGREATAQSISNIWAKILAIGRERYSKRKSPLNFTVHAGSYSDLHYQPEPIAMNIHDLNIGIVFQIFAQFGNVHVHAAAIEVSVAAPDFFQGMFSRQKIVHVLASIFSSSFSFGESVCVLPLWLNSRSLGLK